MNETRAGSITLQLQETIRAIKRYPDALQQVHLGISNAEARIGTVEQTATHRIEVIRAEMSWALHDHKERTDRLIDQLSPEQDRAQFFDISDHRRRSPPLLRSLSLDVDSEYVGNGRVCTFFGPISGNDNSCRKCLVNAAGATSGERVLLRLAIIMAPQRICFVCLERQTGNPAGPNDSGPGAPKGNGSVNDAKKAKCKLFRLEPEPEPAQLRRWLAEMKERVANAFAYDPGYAFAWELKSQMALDTRQILWLLYDFLRPHVTGDSTFKRIDLVELDVQLWDRDDSVRNYAYLRTIRVNAMTTWRRRRNQEKMCILPHDPRQHNGGMLPLHMAVRIDRHHDLREVRVLQDDVIRGVAARIGRRLRDAFRRGVGLLDSRGVLVLAGLRLRVLESTPSLLSPGKRCKELGYRFIWEPFCDPMFFDPKGKRLKIDVINNIPYLLFSETDLPRVYPALPAPIIVHEKVVAVGEAPQGELDEIGELVLDMPQEEKGGPRSSGDKRDVGSNLRGLLLLLLPSLGLTI
eukprot:s519_g22.t3